MGTEDDTFYALKKPPTEDEIAFGRNKWIYCSEHMGPHITGWCTVSARDKRSLEAQNGESAYEECNLRGYPLYNPR